MRKLMSIATTVIAATAGLLAFALLIVSGMALAA
jgi:hypothetical protein